jgi:Protein of unknown function (DUF2652)
MESKGLLFIPDISGFLKFVSQVEIDHSRRIIQELLEILINSNQMGLEVSEIEGDAILFYKFGESPNLEQLYKQVEKMFSEFHKHLLSYNHLKYCQCQACMSVIDLSLKIITHYGEFTGYNVKNFNKLLGKDIIVAHQLLKNDIVQHEYWLVTSSLFQNNPPAGFTEWMKWENSVKQTEAGEVPFHYTQLSQLKNEIVPDEPLHLEIANKVKILSLTKEYDTDIITMFHATGDFNNKGQWLEGVKSVEEVDHYLPRIGMKCRCVMENEQENIYSSSYSYREERVEFSETDEKKMSSTYYLLEKIADNKTRLTIDFYLKKNIILKLIFNLLKKKKIELLFQKSLQNLEVFIKEIKLPS